MESWANLHLNYIWKTSGEVYGVEDNSLLVTCATLGAVLPAEWSWTDPNGTDITSWSSSSDDGVSSLVLPDLYRYDTGDYTCRAEYQDIGASTHLVQATVQYITTSPEDTMVVYGDDVILICGTNYPPTSFSWYKDSVLMAASSSSLVGSSSSSLSLAAVHFNSSGVYSCSASYNSTSTSSPQFQLHARGFTLQPQDTTTVNLTVATLTCVAEGDVAPDVTWYHGNQMLQHSATVSVSTKAIGTTTTSKISLSLLSHTTDNYYCSAMWEGDVIVNSTSASIPILGIAAPPEDTTAVLGNVAVLSCGAGEETAAISWLHNGTNVTATLTMSLSSELELTPVTWSQAGVYQCVAGYPEYGASYAAASVTLSVRGISQSPVGLVTEEESDVTLTCVATGPPAPNITWYKDGNTSPVTGNLVGEYTSLLHLTSVSLATTGNYLCVADYGALGSDSSLDAAVVVRGILSHPTDTTAVKTNSARFSCTTRGEKAPDTITWSRDGVALETGTVTMTTTGNETTSVLLLEEVQEQGQYVCSAGFLDPEGLVVSHTAQLTVFEFVEEPANYGTVLGYPVSLSCSVHDSPSTLAWQHNDTLVEAGVSTLNNVSTLVVDSSTLESAGEYKCFVEYTPSNYTMGGNHSSGVAMVTVSSFVREPSNVHVIEGERAEMTCHVTPYLDPTFTWSPGPVVSSSGTASLAVWEAVSWSDEQQYTCSVEFAGVGNLTSEPANLYVRGLTTTPTEKIAVWGHSASLVCAAHGDGLSVVSWSSAGEQLQVNNLTNVTDFTSTIELANVTQNVNVSCSAAYQLPDTTIVSQDVSVTVYNILEVTESVVLVSGQSATLTCLFDGAAVASWFYSYSEEEIAETVDNSLEGRSTLVLGSVTENSTLECRVSYPAVEGLTQGGVLVSEAAVVLVHDILVHPGNRTVVVGHNTTLDCGGSSNPSISWYRDNTLISSSSPLLLLAAERSDETTYYCRLTWAQGSLISSKVRVTVLDIVVHPMSGIAVDGGNTSASCTAQQTASFTWYKNGQEVDSISDPRYQISESSDGVFSFTQLEIRNATTDTDGSYVCVAEYTPDGIFLGGIVESHPATLTVYRIIGHPEDKFVLFGEDMTLSCQLNDSATITWFHNDADIGAGAETIQDTTITSTLTLANVTWSDAGYYYCEGSYTQGSLTSTPANVFVRGIWIAPLSASVVLHHPATFHCVSRGEADITWLYQAQLHPSTNSTYSDSNWLTMAIFQIDTVSERNASDVLCLINYTETSAMSLSSQPANITVYSVTTNPEDTAGVDTNNASLSCVASGDPTIHWQKTGGGTVPGQTNTTSLEGHVMAYLYFTDIQPSDEGEYKCVADYGGLGEHSSASAQFTVYELTENPEAQAVEVGQSVELVCDSNGTPGSVRWYKDQYFITSSSFVIISTNGSRSTLTISDTELQDKGFYQCEYEFTEGVISSSSAYLSVRGFSVEPHSAVGVEDNSASFTCVVHGETEATITWYKSESPITTTISTTYSSPYTTSTLALSSLQHSTDDEAEIVCRAQFADPELSLSSEVAVLTVLRISAPPANTAVVDTLTATLTCIVDAGGVIAWYNGSGLLDGETEETLVFNPVSVEHQGSYHCQATFAADGNYTFGGTTASEAVTLTVHRFTTVPETQYLIVGDTATFSCEGSGTPETIWYKGEEELQRTSPLVLTDVTFEDDGSYCCRINYTAGEIASEWVELHVRGVSTSPVQTTGVLGGSVLLQCTATGSTQPTFYWTRDHVNISGEATSSFSDPYTDTNFTYTGVVEEDATAEFRCVAVFLGQSHSSQPASITVLEVTGPPADVYGVVGTSASLSCSTAGPPAPASFSWLQDQLLLQGQERYAFTAETELDTTLTISELERSDDGEYACVPTYEAEALFLGGNTTSEAASLTIIGLTEPPVQTIVKVGDTAIFTCKADAVPVPTLSWYKDATALTDGVSAPTTTDGEVVSYLTIEDVGDDDVAPYSCTAFYPSLGQHTSEDANLRFRGIEEAPLVTRAVIGLSNQLNCTARGEAVADMAWTANGTVIAASSLYNIITSSNYDGTDEQDLIDTRTIMTISEVSLNIAYLEIQCVATWLSNGQASEVSSDPVSFYALYVYDSPGDTIAVRYTKVELSCIATGTPLIRWDRSGRTYGVGISDVEDYTRTTSTLIIGNVTTADEGNIWCVAEYAEGMHDSDEATLTVVGIVTEPATTTTSQRGQSIQFTCTVDRYPANNVTWFKGDTQIHGYENRKNMTITTEQYLVEYVLWISSITEDDMAAYYCVVDYPQGTQTSQPAYLLIEEPPEITLIVATGGEKEGDSIELLCQATGVPKPDITWRRGGQEFPADDTVSVVTIYNEPGSSLVMINSSSSEDQGVYSCVASNGVGDTAIMETELVIESAVRAVTVVSASSLLGFIVAVCTALMLFALYKKRKRKRLHPNEETKIPPTPNEEDVENHVYDNEARVRAGPKVAFQLIRATTKL